MTISYRILLLLLILFYSCKSTKKLDKDSPYAFDFIEIETVVGLSDVATLENKLIFVDVYADWCLPCKTMDEDIFTDNRLGKFYNDNFVSYKADSENGVGADIAELYNVAVLPTLLFLDNNGNLLAQQSGSANINEMYELAERAMAISSKKLGE